MEIAELYLHILTTNELYEAVGVVLIEVGFSTNKRIIVVLIYRCAIHVQNEDHSCQMNLLTMT